MTEQQFLLALEKELKKIPKVDRDDILQDFQEHFAIGIAEGKDEQQIVASLGSPQQIAKEMMATSEFDQTKSDMTSGNMIRVILISIGVIFFNLVVVFGPYIAIVSLIFSGWLVGISFISTPVILMINILLYPGSFILFEFFLTIALSGLGIFITMGMYLLTKGIVYGTKKYVQFNSNLVKGGLQS